MMEKASSTPNRLTRSSARTTTSIKSEDASELNPAEEIKQNRRKSRRKTETKLNTNGDSLNDVDTKKLKNYDEISEGNSYDGCDSEDSNADSVHKNNYQANKVSSPAISRKSLRSRSITSRPELEPSVTRKMRRSTSESKLDSVHTPTKRRLTRAKSESKDFVFSPSKNNSDYENSYTESNSKCIPINSALRVIDEIIEEVNELEPHHVSPKTSLTTLKTVEVETVDNVLKCDKKEDIHQNENCKSDSKEYNIAPPVTQVNVHLATSEEAEGDKEAVDTSNEATDHLEMGTESEFAQKSNNQLSSVEEVNVTQEATNQEVVILLETGDQSPTPQPDSNENTPDTLITEVSDHLPIKEEAKGGKYKVDSPSKIHDHLVMSSNPESVTKSNNQLSVLQEGNEFQETSSQQIDILKETGDQCSIPQPGSNEYTPAVLVAEVSDHLPIPEEAEGDKYAVDTAIERQDHLVLLSDSDSVTKLNCQLSGLEEVDATQETKNQEVDIKETGDQLSMVVNTESSKKSSDQSSEETDSVKESSPQLPISEGVTSDEISEEAKADLQSGDKIVNNVEEGSNCHTAHFANDNSLNNEVLLKNNESDRTDDSFTKCIEIDDVGSEKELHDITKTQSIKSVKAANDNCSLKTIQLEISTTGPKNVPMTENNNISLMLEVESENEDSVAPNQNSALPNLVNSESLSVSPTKSLIISDNGTKSSQSDKNEADENSRLKKNNMLGTFEDKDSASESELYKNMSDFGSDMDEKKDGSQYGDSASTDLRSGDSEEYVSSFDGEEGEEDEEETNNEENQPSNDKGKLENIHNSISNTKMAGNDFDNTSPMTYDQALALINKNRVKKIDDEEFFDMFTKELNKVSEESGSDSDIAIVDEYIAEPEEKQQNKSNQKSENLQANVKNPQRPAPPNAVSQRQMPPPGTYNQKIPMQLQRINLKSSQKSESSPNSVSNNFSGNYNQQAQTEHSHPSMARMTFSQDGLYHQYNQTMPSMDSNRGPYDQFAPPSNHMEDPRMFQPHHIVPDNFPRGSMFGHPLGPVSDAQMHYSSGSTIKVRNIDSMCLSHPSNAMNLNSFSSGQTENPLRNEYDGNRIMGVSASTMTELAKTSSSQKADTITSPILEMLGLDKKKLKMLKNVLGLDESREKQRAKIKEILIEEAHKIGLKLKSSAKIKNQIQREQKHSLESSAQAKARKKYLIEQIVDSDSDSCSLSLQSGSVHSSAESHTKSEPTSNISKKSQSSSDSLNENEVGMRTVNVEDGGVCVRIDTRPKRKLRHRARKNIPMVSIDTNELKRKYQFGESSDEVSIDTNERKRKYQFGESSDEENLKDMRKKKPRQRNKMAQEIKQNKKQTTLVQSNCGTFIVNSVTSTSQSESETVQEDTTTNREEHLRTMKEDLAAGKNKLSNMFRLHSLKEEKKGLKRKLNTTYSQSEEEMEPMATKSKRLPAHLLAKLGGEEVKIKKQKKDQTTDSESEELPRRARKPRKRANSKKLKISSTAAQKHYIPLVVAAPTQFGLQRLDKNATLSSVEKAANFRSDHLYGSSVKRITSQELMSVKKKQHGNKLAESKKEMKKAGRKLK